MNQALDDVRAAEARRMAQAGFEPVLKKSRWCLLKRKENLTGKQKLRLRDLLRYKWAGKFLNECAARLSTPASNP